MWSSAVDLHDMYDQLAICVFNRNFIYKEDYARLLESSKHGT